MQFVKFSLGIVFMMMLGLNLIAQEAEEKKPENILDRRVRKGKLYKQWVAYSDLPTDEIRSTKTSRDIPVTGQRNRRSLTLLYILLGVCIGILCLGLFFLLTPYF